MNPTALSVSVRDAAALTGLSEYEIRTAVSKGELFARKRGRRIVIPVDGLKAWIDGLPSVTDAQAS